jgi:hypothetical protein
MASIIFFSGRVKPFLAQPADDLGLGAGGASTGFGISLGGLRTNLGVITLSWGGLASIEVGTRGDGAAELPKGSVHEL